MNSKPWLIHVSHEAVRPLGGVGVQIRHLIDTQALRDKFQNQIVLAGPLFFPEEGDCRTQTNKATLIALKKRLPSLNRIYPSKNPERDSILVNRFKRIEECFGVYLYYYTAVPGSHDYNSHNTSLLIVDHSSVFGHSFIQTPFFNEIVSKINQETESTLYEFEFHPNRMRLGERIRKELLENSDQVEVSRELLEEMDKPIVRIKDYHDYDYILGLLIAEPLSRAISALCHNEDSTYLVANDYFGIPTLYQSKRERAKTKTILYVTEVNPARHLVEQKLPCSTNTSTNEPIDSKNVEILGDGRFYNLMKVGKNKSMESVFKEIGELFSDLQSHFSEQDTETNRKRGRFAESARRCRETRESLSIEKHTSSKIFQSLVKNPGMIDKVLANGPNSKDELCWLLKSSSKEEVNVSVIPHGMPRSIDACTDVGFKKEQEKKKILRRLNRSKGVCISGGEQSLGRFHVPLDTKQFLFIKISRPVLCKAFDRDLLVCKHLDSLIKEDGYKANFVIVSHWDNEQENNPINSWIKEARENKLESVDFFFINQFDWPNSLEDRDLSLDRDSLLWASDVSFSQSRYESFGLAQIEPLAFGSLCLISSASGAYFPLKKHVDESDNETPIIFADYMCSEAIKDYSIRQVFEYNWRSSEQKIAEEIARKIYCKLTKGNKVSAYKKGIRLLDVFDWEEIASNFLKTL
ncbi:MAG: hypothetical protein AAF722_02080 [Cyanobacteria bacterium P01_C01_bin.70]